MCLSVCVCTGINPLNPSPPPPPQEEEQQHVPAGGSSRGSRAAAAGIGGADAAGGEYHDSNEVDKTGMEGHVTQVPERASAYLSLSLSRARALHLS